MSSLAPALLLSMPQMMDPNFARAVVLLCKHSEDGAFGLVLNRPLVTTGTVMVHLNPPVSTDRELDIWIGGPVEPQRSWILVGGGPGISPRSSVRRRLPTVSISRRRPFSFGASSSPILPPTLASSSATPAGHPGNSRTSSPSRRGC
ncbi:MAG: YqgE/AlgH family protein [Vicinamibacterales bacterium]